MEADPFPSIREREFPHVAEGGAFFDAASYGILPRRTVHVVEELTAARTGPRGISDEEIVRHLERAREAAARLVGAGRDDIVLAPNTSYGVNLAAHLTAAGPPGTILLSQGEFPANVLPWVPLERDGFRVELVPLDESGWPDEERLLERLEGDDVRAFALSAVQFQTGYRSRLERFGRVCRERGILYCVDAIQALGVVPLDDVERSGIDVLASGAQKWLCSPWGSGFAYIRGELRDRFDPPMVSWLAMEDSGNFDRLLDYRLAFAEGGRKFELATLGTQDYAGMGRSIELMIEVGVERIRQHVRAVQRPLAEWVESRGDVQAVTPYDPERRAGIFSFRSPDPGATAERMEREGFRLSVREGAIRVSAHLYNTVDEMERLVGVLSGD